MALARSEETISPVGMTIREIMHLVEAELIFGEDKLDVQVEQAFAADLMSDVLTFAKEGSILLTGLTNPQVVRTAEMLDLPAILFVRGKRPQEEAIDLARDSGIPLLATPYILFETCGRLYKAGIVSCRDRVD